MRERFKVVLVANDDHPIPDWVSPKFEAAGIDYEYHQCYGRDDLIAHAADADLVWLQSSRKGLVIEENMDVFQNIKAVVRIGSGTDNIDRQACTKRGILIAHTPEDVIEFASDHMIAMLFTAVRRTARQDRLVRQGTWDVHAAMPVGHFLGAELGLIGFGRIGRSVARHLCGFEMKLRVYDPFVDAATIQQAGGTKVELTELLQKSQFVLVACPLTEDTRGLIGREELALMRSDATLVNGARGGIVDEAALLEVLKEGRIMAAALDVVENVPLDKDSELLKLDNLNVTPHIGGYSDNYPDDLFYTTVDTIIRISRRQPPQWIVNPEVTSNWIVPEV